MSARGGPFSTRALAWLVGVGGSSLLLAFVLTGVADRFGGPVSAGADAFSKSAVGHRGLTEFLDASGIDVRVRRNPSASSPPGELWLMLEPVPRHDPAGDAFDPVEDVLMVRWLEDAPIVLVPPKWSWQRGATRPDHIVQANRLPVDVAMLPFGALEVLTGTPIALESPRADIERSCVSAWGERYEVRLARPRAIGDVPGFEPVLSCGDVVLAGVHPYPDGTADILVIADADLVSNHGLGRADHARFLLDLIERNSDGTVLIDETVHGYALEGGVLAAMFRFPLVLLVIQGVLLAAAAVWSGARRFGSPRPAPAALGTGKQVLIGNVADLIAVIGRTADLLPRYRRQTVRAVARYYGLGDGTGEDLERHLAEIERSRGVEPTLAQLTKTMSRSGTRGRTPERAIETASQLHRWRTEMTHVD